MTQGSQKTGNGFLRRVEGLTGGGWGRTTKGSHLAVGVFGTEAAPLTQDADLLPVALLPAGGGRASQLPAAPPQLAPDEPVEDAEA